jgi:RNA polymerase sigma-70 factor (ECF subfamily)
MNTQKITQEEWVCCAMNEYEGRLLGYAKQIVGSHDKAQDVVQDTFIKLCHADRHEIRHLKAWLFKVCRNGALEILRKEKRMVQMTDASLQTRESSEPAPDAQAVEHDRINHALKLVDTLPEKQQEVVVLKYRNGLSYSEISEIAGVSVSNVGFLLHTALKTLRRQMSCTEGGVS